MKSDMRTRAAWMLFTPMAAWLEASCASPGIAVTPPQEPSEPGQNHSIQREQQALEERRLQLQNQIMADLRKLRESRQASTAAVEPTSEESADTKGDGQLLIFGGATRDAFLGCLCDEQHPDSVFNMLGPHGSHDSPTSLRNKFAPYGSNHDDTSACSATAKHPPVVLSPEGKSLGLLTMNAALKRRIDSKAVNDWLGRMCGE
jgi:hypothetical protein